MRRVPRNIRGTGARDQFRFTCGDCHILAKRIARVTGWTLATFGYGGDPCLHAFVICPDGEALDIDGKRPLAQFCQDWRASDLEVMRWTERATFERSEWWQPPQFGRYSYARARVVASRILEGLNQ